jgi:hypothetical protein
MKKLLATLLLLPALAQAELPIVDRSTVCIGPDQLEETLEQFEELPLARGASIDIETGFPLSLVIFVNPTTRSFTIVERTLYGEFCILSVGGEFEPVPQAIQDNLKQQRDQEKL